MSSFLPSFHPTAKLQKELVNDFVNSVELDIIDDQPVNEFNTQYLATMAFPTLFPDGRGDPTNNAIIREIASGELNSFAYKIKHLLKFAENIDGQWEFRFAKHPRFAYWAFNMLYRRRILSRGNLYVKRNPGQLDFTLEDFNEMLQNRSSCSSFMSKIFYYTKEITGSKSYWNRIRQELTATIEQVGVPTVFFTLSMAEFHWTDFLDIFGFGINEEVDVRKVVRENPHLVDWYFTERTAVFVKSWLYDYLGASWHWYRFEYASRGSIHCHGLAKLSNDPGLVHLTSVALQGYLAGKRLTAVDIVLNESEIAQLSAKMESGALAEKLVCDYVDSVLSTINPVEIDTWRKPDVHPCKTNIESLDGSLLEKDF